MKVAIVGAGMGGLALARALQQAGIDVDVFEQSSELREVGAGVQVTPNASRVLASLGLADELARDGCRAEVSQARRWDDFSLIAETELAESLPAQFGSPWYCVHRSDLQTMLRVSLAGDVVHLGRRVAGLAETPGGVRLDFADGSEATADIVVGADGIHSQVRTHLFGPTPARFTGIIAYRGLVPAGEIADLGLAHGSTLVMGPDQHVVCYPVSAGRNVNWVALAPRDDWDLESWTEPATVTDALAAYDGWAPQLQRLIASAGADDRQINRWALHDRDPLPAWGCGRITLLGDAAHAMLPFVAQGAAQAFEDAAVLARCLQRLEPLDALRAYEDLRRDRTAKVQLAARANGVLFHLPDGPDQRARDTAMAAPRPAGRHAQSWIFEYDPELATSTL